MGRANMTSETKSRGWVLRTFFALVLALPVGNLHAVVQGQDTGAVSPPRLQARHQTTRPNLDDRISRFAKGLDLSETQQAAVKKILEDRQRQILSIKRNESISGSARIIQFRVLQNITVERIRAVLNEEQKQKYDPLAPRKIPSTEQPSVEDWLKAIAKH
jgi:hypothetical protein